MDNLRGTFDTSETAEDSQDWDAGEEEAVRNLPPDAIGQDERRMQVRAYNHWASLLGERTFPSIEDLEPENLPDFGPSSVVLDFSVGIDDPAVQFLGGKLAEECGVDGEIAKLSDVPPRSLLSRITDHYMQILANQAPIGFEAEFVNQRGVSILYRGILLPFSSNEDTIDFIYGVINWKEMADQATADELLLDLDQALEGDIEPEEEDEPHKHHSDPLTEWADSPAAEDQDADTEQDAELAEDDSAEAVSQTDADNVAHFSGRLEAEEEAVPAQDAGLDDLPTPNFGDYSLDDFDDEEEEGEDDAAAYDFASLTDHIEAPTKKPLALEDLDFDESELEGSDFQAEDFADGSPVGAEPESTEFADGEFDEAELEAAALEEAGLDGADLGDVEFEQAAVVAPAPSLADIGGHTGNSDDVIELTEELPADAGLYDCLASAREMAQTARTSEDRSRHALYAAVGRAYDFSIEAQQSPEEYNELVAECGLTVQERAPMTPVVKLVFGTEYDKTRLTEYATVLSHAHRLGLERGSLASFLGDAEGGLKGVVSAERRMRREESGEPVETAQSRQEALARKLRELEALTFDALASEGPEFGLVMIRRNQDGGVELLGEIDQDLSLIERAARKLVA